MLFSDVYGGRLSDPKVMRLSGLFEQLKKKAFAHKDLFPVTADRGFNPIALDSLTKGMLHITPPNKRSRQRGLQFSEEDASRTQKTANLRINLDRAIRGMKERQILHTKCRYSSSKQMDLIPSIVELTAAFVHMNRPSSRGFTKVGDPYRLSLG